MKITNPELFWNASKIILVGTGNVLRPTEIFSDLTVTDISMNRESAFWLLYEKPSFRAFSKRLLEGLGD